MGAAHRGSSRIRRTIMSIYPVSLSGTVNTLMWADETGIEEAAIRQLRNVSALP